MRFRSERCSLTEALQWPPGFTPVEACWLWVGQALYGWQEDVLVQAAVPRARVAISTCNESGKTSILLPVFALTAMAAFPRCSVYVTSGSEDQVKNQLFVENFEPILRDYPGWVVSTSAMTITAPNGSRLLGYKCKEGGKVEGFHGKWQKVKGRGWIYRPCVYLMDECKTISDDIFEAVKRIDPDFLLAVSTPGGEKGWFWRAIDPTSLRLEQKDREKDENLSEDAIMAKIQAAKERLLQLQGME